LKTTDVRFAGPVSPEGNDYTLEPQVFDEDFEGDILDHLSSVRYEDDNTLLNQDPSETIDPSKLTTI
jgi:hypothetical protein